MRGGGKEEAVDHHVYRLDHQEEHGGADDEQGEHPVDEISVGKDCVMDGEVELAEVGFAEQGGDQRVNKVPDQALDHSGERHADDDAHGQINHVAAQDELAEFCNQFAHDFSFHPREQRLTCSARSWFPLSGDQSPAGRLAIGVGPGRMIGLVISGSSGSRGEPAVWPCRGWVDGETPGSRN